MKPRLAIATIAILAVVIAITLFVRQRSSDEPASKRPPAPTQAPTLIGKSSTPQTDIDPRRPEGMDDLSWSRMLDYIEKARAANGPIVFMAV